MLKRRTEIEIDFTFPIALFTAFFVLKMCNVINGSWWWITAPLWINAALGIVVLTLKGIFK